MNVKTVADQFGANALFFSDVKRGADDPGLSVVKSRLSVEQMGYVANAEFYRVNGLVISRVGMRDRNGAYRLYLFYKFVAAVAFGRDINNFDRAVAPVEKPLELLFVGISDIKRILRAFFDIAI